MNKKLLLSVFAITLCSMQLSASQAAPETISFTNTAGKNLYIQDASHTVLASGQSYTLNVGSSVQVSFAPNFSNPWKFEAYKHPALPGTRYNPGGIPAYNALRISNAQGVVNLDRGTPVNLTFKPEFNNWYPA